nr:cytochrome P450 4c3-like [Leptinotarsa decemlineata]
MSFVLGTIFAVIVAVLGYRWYNLLSIKQKLNWVTHIPGWPLVGNALEFGGTEVLLNDMSRLFKKHGKILFVDFVGKANIFTVDYDFIEFVLGTHYILDKSRDYRFIRNWLGTGLLTSDGPKWKGRRRIATPAFHFSILEQFVEIFEKNGNIMINKLKKEVDKDSIDIYPFITLCALDIICETAMGVPVDAQLKENSQYVKNVKLMCKIGVLRSTSILKNNDFFYPLTLDYYREQKAVKQLHEVTNSVIESRMKHLESSGGKVKENTDELGRKKKLAFLDILLQSTVDGKPLSIEDIREEVDTFMFEGHDTTASAMTFTSFLLAGHPEVQARALEEQTSVFADDLLRPATYKDLMEMKYLECVIKESLRIYPSVPLYGRHTHEDVNYKGNVIPKGTDIIIFDYGILHDPEIYPDPEKFDPSRFEEIDGKRPFNYIPFSAGPRNCIGQKFAMLEMKCTLSKILRNFELRPATPKHTLKLTPEAVLKSSNGVRIQVRPRKL